MDIGNLVLGVIVSLIYFLLGLAMRLRPVHEREETRSSKSLGNKQQWFEGDGYSAKLMMWIGTILLVTSVICGFWIREAAGFTVILLAAVILAVGMIVLVERRRRKT
ncbi:hypothetical protein GRF59_06530 [Paenibacillus sp. HJL G12]|uniref:SdpI family protein n=1 Tax=Paenibacillus dendrobii TaxID=2691084 RepID=A0A7X3IG25_9BACL|nr:hypothetical protein [Paenibacillus dendrobii]MWV43284.1 hypothetical protein [Paenibacillus dendrobii]